MPIFSLTIGGEAWRSLEQLWRTLLRTMRPNSCWSPTVWEDWLRGRKARRESSKLVAPGNLRRESSSKDRRLRKLFNGERGLPFTPTDKL